MLGEPPLADMHPMRALVSIPRNPPPCLRQPKEWSDDFNDFIRQCLIKDFEARPTVAQMIKHRFISQIPEDGIDARRRIVQFIHRYKQCYDLAGQKSRETCGVKNGRIRGKSETGSSAIVDGIEINGHAQTSNAGAIDSDAMIPAPLKKIIQVIGKPYNPPHQVVDTQQRSVALPLLAIETVKADKSSPNEPTCRSSSQQIQLYKTKRKIDSKRVPHQSKVNRVSSSSDHVLEKKK